MSEISEIWVFMGASGRFPSGVFTNRDVAATWIQKNKLTGVLTAYPLNAGVYEWAITKGYFEPKKDHEGTADFIQRFSCASQEHYHFENGELD